MRLSQIANPLIFLTPENVPARDIARLPGMVGFTHPARESGHAPTYGPALPATRFTHSHR